MKTICHLVYYHLIDTKFLRFANQKKKEDRKDVCFWVLVLVKD